MQILLKNGHVVDPVNNIDGVCDILIKDGRIQEIRKNGDSPHFSKEDGAQTIDLAGKHVFPGLIDMHTHLREPGREDEETIFSGTRAAARGGFTSVL